MSRGQQVAGARASPLPDLDGLEIIRRIREWTTVPIIVLSTRDREGRKIEALDLRRAPPRGPGQPATVALTRRQVSVSSTEVHLRAGHDDQPAPDEAPDDAADDAGWRASRSDDVRLVAQPSQCRQCRPTRLD